MLASSFSAIKQINRKGMVGMIILLALIGMALLAPFWPL